MLFCTTFERKYSLCFFFIVFRAISNLIMCKNNIERNFFSEILILNTKKEHKVILI